MGDRVPHDPLERINAHRLDELDAIARAFGGVANVRGVPAERVDAEGIDIAVEARSGPTTARVRFLDPVSDYPLGVRVAFVRLARRARSVLEASEMTGGTRP